MSSREDIEQVLKQYFQDPNYAEKMAPIVKSLFEAMDSGDNPIAAATKAMAQHDLPSEEKTPQTLKGRNLLESMRKFLRREW